MLYTRLVQSLHPPLTLRSIEISRNKINKRYYSVKRAHIHAIYMSIDFVRGPKFKVGMRTFGDQGFLLKRSLKGVVTTGTEVRLYNVSIHVLFRLLQMLRL